MNDLGPLADNRLGTAIFFPRPDSPFGPVAPNATDHMFEVEPGVSLRLRVFEGPSDAPAILFFHGNGETARDYDGIAEAYCDLPATLVVAEYRGYGPSSGRPSLRTLLDDAHKTLDEVKRRLESSGKRGKLVVMGRSLGSAPAIELAARRTSEISALIVESGFSRLVPLLELLGIPAKMLGVEEGHGPRNAAKIAACELPTLIMHAENDMIIPVVDAEQLYAASPDPQKVLMRVPNAGHNDIQFRAGDAYFQAMKALLARI